MALRAPILGFLTFALVCFAQAGPDIAPAGAAERIIGYDGVVLGMSSHQARQALRTRDTLRDCARPDPAWTGCLTYDLPGKSFASQVFLVFQARKLKYIRVVPQVAGIQLNRDYCRLLYRTLSQGVRRSIGAPTESREVPSRAGPAVFFSVWGRGARHARVIGTWSEREQRCRDSALEFVDAPLPAALGSAEAAEDCGLRANVRAWTLRAEEIAEEFRTREARYSSELRERLRVLGRLGELSSGEARQMEEEILNKARAVSQSDQALIEGEISKFLGSAVAGDTTACAKLTALRASTRGTLRENRKSWELFVSALDRQIAEISR